MFKLTMQKEMLDTKATNSHLRENLTKLEAYISPVKSNIDTFNQHEKINGEGFKVRGERMEDLTTNMFKVYHVNSDTEFIRYIKTNKDHYYYGEEITLEQLLTTALHKYEVLLTSGNWNVMSPKQEKIVELKILVGKTKDENLKLSRYANKSPNKGERKDRNQGLGTRTTNKGSRLFKQT